MQIYGWETPFFRLRGPFEELGNVGLCFVVLQLLRMVVGTLCVAFVEFWCRKGPMKRDERRRLASESWYCVYYTVILVWGYKLFFEMTGWAYDVEGVCGWEPIEVAFSAWRSLHVYHCVQVAFYCNYLFAMVAHIDQLRQDWWAYAAHHLITIGLILFSRNFGYMRVQLAILGESSPHTPPPCPLTWTDPTVLHDAADPWFSLSKIVKLARPHWVAIPDSIMGFFALVFLATRWFMYPIFLVASCRDNWLRDHPFDWLRIAPDTWWSVGHANILILGVTFSYYGLAMLLLYALYGLHLYWGSYIMLMAWRKLVVGSVPINSTGDENESSAAASKKPKGE
jgi:hypothetical protein